MYDEKYQQQRAEKIRYQYEVHEETKFEKLQKLDKTVKRPAGICAYVVGVIASLTLGTGMCLAMNVIGGGGALMTGIGVAVGVVGIALCACNYFVYKAILAKRKKKYAKQILDLSEELISQQDQD